MHTFRATVELAGKTATGVAVPPPIVEALDGGRQPLVHVAIGDYRYRSKLGVRGGRAMLPISGEHRAGAGVAAGDEIEVTLTLDTDPREVEIPVDLAVALDASPAAHRAFAALSNSRKQAITLSVEGAKTAETRARRVAKARDQLAAN
jgi:hypothetical protein